MSETADTMVVKKYLAELIGTFLLVMGGVGTLMLAGHDVGWLGVSLAFGLTLMFLNYAIGPISGCHVNPAVTLGQLVLGRIPFGTAIGYWISQLVGGFLAGIVIFALANDLPRYRRAAQGLGANGWGSHSPSARTDLQTGNFDQGYGLAATIIVEVILTAVLVFVVMAATDRIAEKALAGLAIGVTLTVIHLISIPVDGTSVNPARSLAVAPYQTGAMQQVWAFIVFPLIGGGLGAVIYSSLFSRSRAGIVNRATSQVFTETTINPTK